MKLSVTYLYTIFRYGYPPEPKHDFQALTEISKLGFRYLEMEGLGRRHTAGVWQRRAEFRQRLRDAGLHVHNFCGVDPDLVSLDRARRRRGYERFKRTAELGAYLGAETLHLASYAPPVKYLGRSPYALGEDYSFADSFRMRIPRGFSWARVWDTLVESCQTTARVAAGHGRTIIIEPRIGELVCSVDSMIRLLDDVGMKNFKANFDTGHFSAQRENVPLALMKLEGKFANIHISDNDPATAEHLPIGRGAIDWAEFFRVLKRQHYQGYLGLDFGPRDARGSAYRSSVAYLRQVAARVGVALEH
jgi:sugar phosphate isomerase/epimerase